MVSSIVPLLFKQTVMIETFIDLKGAVLPAHTFSILSIARVTSSTSMAFMQALPRPHTASLEFDAPLRSHPVSPDHDTARPDIRVASV